MLALLDAKCKHVDRAAQLSALRFVRACVGRADKYNRYLIKHNLLRPVLGVLERYKARDNLL